MSLVSRIVGHPATKAVINWPPIAKLLKWYRVHATTIKKAISAGVLSSFIGWVVFEHTPLSIRAADVTSGVAALIAVIGVFAALHPRLNYVLLPRKVRKTHINQIGWLTTSMSGVFVGLSGSTGEGGLRTDALATVHIMSRLIPKLPPGRIDEHFEVPKELLDEINRHKKAAEEVLKARKGLEGPRWLYQQNLYNALGELIKKAGYELGGHGYVTDLWEGTYIQN